MVSGMQAIEIKNMNFSYMDIDVFEKFNLNIPAGKFVSILGKNGSGKTTLVNILDGKLKCSGDILFFGKKYFGGLVTICDDMDEYETNDTVLDLVHGFKDVAVELEFDDVLNDVFNNLCLEKKKLVILGRALILNPKILVIDNLFEGMDKNLRKRILKKLKKKSITIINFSNDAEESLFADFVVVIGSGKVLLKGSKRRVFENVEFLEKNDIGVPFIVNLSDKLKFYELIDKTYFDEKKLVDDLWE